MANGDPLIQGAVNTTQSATQLVNLAGAGDGTGLYVAGHGADRAGGVFYGWEGDGVQATALPGSPNGAGVRGLSYATSGVGVHGLSRLGSGAPGAGYGVWGEGAIGTVGITERDFGIGLEGNASGEGVIAVYALAYGNRAIGVAAYAPLENDGAALYVNGRAVFSSSGRIVVAAGATSGSQSGLTLSAAALVIATIQQDLPDVVVRAAVPNPATGTVTVHLNHATNVDAAVGWMVVN